MSVNNKKEPLQHRYLLVGVLIVGFIYLLPHILFSIPKINPYPYKLCYPFGAYDRAHYLVMIKEASEGHYDFCNSYLKEAKEGCDNNVAVIFTPIVLIGII